MELQQMINTQAKVTYRLNIDLTVALSELAEREHWPVYARALAHTLAQLSDPYSTCSFLEISLRQLARKAGCCLRTVQKYIMFLEARQVLCRMASLPGRVIRRLWNTERLRILAYDGWSDMIQQKRRLRRALSRAALLPAADDEAGGGSNQQARLHDDEPSRFHFRPQGHGPWPGDEERVRSMQSDVQRAASEWWSDDEIRRRLEELEPTRRPAPPPSPAPPEWKRLEKLPPPRYDPEVWRLQREWSRNPKQLRRPLSETLERIQRRLEERRRQAPPLESEPEDW